MIHGGELVQQATDAAWRIIRALERPGAELPLPTEVADACANARRLVDICNVLQEGPVPTSSPPSSFDPDEPSMFPFLY